VIADENAVLRAAVNQIGQRHVPDHFSAATQCLVCRHCRRDWPCPDRRSVGPLFRDRFTRLIPSEGFVS